MSCKYEDTNDLITIKSCNLSSEDLDTKPLKYGLHHSFTNKNKYVKRNIAVELESLATSLEKFVDQSLKEFFHEYLRSSTNVLVKNIYSDKDATFKSLHSLRKNKDIVVLATDKESCTVILNKDDYIKTVNDIIEDAIKQMKYIETTDDTCNELKRLQEFFYRHFYKHEHYEVMRPRSTQPDQLFATVKIYKFESISDNTLEQLKLRPIIDQTGTYIYKALKVVAKYLGPLAKNEYTIRDTLSFLDLLKNVPYDDNYEDVSYDVESLFTSIPVQETIDYTLYKI